MYDNWIANTAVAIATLIAVSSVVLIHYEGLVLLSRVLARAGGRQRVKLLYAIAGVLGLHVAEIWTFGIVGWMLLGWPECGQVVLDGVSGRLSLLDAVYLSSITFTTVGYGDIVPLGPIRFLAGTEALTGFVLIGWSASFTYLEMERFWRRP